MPWNPDSAEGKEVCMHRVQKGYYCPQCHDSANLPLPPMPGPVVGDPLRVTIVMSKQDHDALLIELQAVHSDLGDASQIIFDLIDQLTAEKARAQALESKITRLRTSVESMKRKMAAVL